MDNPMNLDQNTIQNLQKMFGEKDLSNAMSQISPEMISNFSKMFSKSQTNSSTQNSNINNNTNNTNTENNHNENENQNNKSSNTNFDFNNIDIQTIMKISSAFNNMNQKNDPRANLISSLKPYLRDSKKDKLDNYVNILKVSKIAEILKNENKENEDNANNE